jgi:hypothetical protein
MQALLRVIFFAWSVAMGKILTLDNLRKRHVIVMNRCCMCKRSKDTVDHLLLHCEVASALWSAIFGCFGMSWVMPRWVSELFASWWSLGGGGVPRFEKMVPTCLFYCLWRERNNRCFENFERSTEDILSSCFLLCILGL